MIHCYNKYAVKVKTGKKKRKKKLCISKSYGGIRVILYSLCKL